MYRVLCDNLPLYDLRDERLVLADPKVELQENSAGSFTFTILPTHPHYDSIKKMKSVIRVMDNEDEIFCGRAIAEEVDFYNRKKVTCEGELGFFNDSVQRPAVYRDITVREFLQKLIEIHNAQITEETFEVGQVTVVDSNDSVYKYTNWESTFQVIKTDLLDTYGGHLRIRKENGVRYLDYLAEYPNVNTQVIEFGQNLLDFTKDLDAADIATAVIPLGAKLDESSIEGLEERVTIASVNDGVDYVESESAVDTYGHIYKTVIFDDVHVPDNLLQKGQEYLQSIQFENMMLTVKAIDLHMMNVDVERIKMLDEIRVISAPNGLDRRFPVTKMTIQIDRPSNNTITLGQSVSTGMTGSASSANEELKKRLDELPSLGSAVKEAVDNASQLIHSALNGHVVITENADELLIMDTDDIATAQRLWRWNLNGLGYSSTGFNGTYATAMTMDGQIVGERLVGNSVTAEKLDVSYKTSVEKKITDSLQSAEGYTDEKLKSYWVKTEIETAIKNTGDSVLISATEKATAYTDSKLKDYSTSAQIKVTTDAIEQEVKKKLNSSELSTKIQQDADSVKIAWNNISKYIEFEAGELRIYDSTNTSTHKLVSAYGSYGARYYYKGNLTGIIGTNALAGSNGARGLVFDLEDGDTYMAWAAKDSSGASAYTLKMAYYNSEILGNKKGLHFGCDVYAKGKLYLTDNVRAVSLAPNSSLGFNGETAFMNKSNLVSCAIDGVNKTFKIYSNVTIDFFADLNMNGKSVTNSSDARLKRNIKPTAIKGLSTINSIDLKQFDWIETGEHQPIGIVAQQLAPSAPELIEEDAKTGRLMLKTDKLVYYCIKAIQELSERLGIEQNKTEWTDPYSELEKSAFCAKLEPGTRVEKIIEHEPIRIPIEK